MSRELRAGDLVEVRPIAEILATLNSTGTRGGMPFMPEMRQFAGRRLTVRARADKTCDTTNRTGLRRLHETVHLEDLRCDGSAHGGCQAGCLLYWNEAWLRPVKPASADVPSPTAAGTEPPVTMADLSALTQLEAADPDAPVRYSCQATEMYAASEALPWWGPAQYLRDLRTRNATIRQLAVGLYRWLSVRVQWRLNGSGVPGIKGTLRRTPRETLDLQPGEVVRVKSKKAIEATLDTGNRNRGLRIDPDQLLFTGGEFRVLRRVERIIDERTREMISIPGDCIVLDGTTCTGAFNRACPRADNPYWREIWLERVGPPKEPVFSSAAEAAAALAAAETAAAAREPVAVGPGLASSISVPIPIEPDAATPAANS